MYRSLRAKGEMNKRIKAKELNSKPENRLEDHDTSLKCILATEKASASD